MKHRETPFESALEQVEQIIENLETDKPVRLSDITRQINPAVQNGEISKATCLLLQKYGITYTDDYCNLRKG